SGQDYRNGQHNASSSFALNADDNQAQGIADPPTVTVEAPPQDSTLPAFSPVVISGRTADDFGAQVTSVLVNGTPPDVVDAGGNFFAKVTADVGTNTFAV